MQDKCSNVGGYLFKPYSSSGCELLLSSESPTWCIFPGAKFQTKGQNSDLYKFAKCINFNLFKPGAHEKILVAQFCQRTKLLRLRHHLATGC